MKFLILTYDYSDFLRWFYGQQPALSHQSYAQQLQARINTLFGGPYVYSSTLKTLGHEAEDIYWNNEHMQTAWARENSFRVKSIGEWEFRLRRGIVPWISRLRDTRRRLYWILAEQIKRFKPDVLFNQAMDDISSQFIKEMKPHTRLVMGQHAAPLPAGADFSCYDLVTSSLPDIVDYFRKRGVSAELNHLGFDGRSMSCAAADAERFDVTFVGTLFRTHSRRVSMLESLCSRFPQLRIWAPNVEHVLPTSAIRSVYQGPVWGCEMYRVLSRSRITINNHGDFAPYANNGRLYEATGMGALLITDWKENLPELFEPGMEVVAYRSAEECADLVNYYLQHDQKRAAIANAGQRRAHTDHAYDKRVRELADIVRKYI